MIGLSEPGKEVLHYARKVLSAVASLTAIGTEHQQQNLGVLRIGATHTQARYVLPPAIHRFRQIYPDVEIQLHQGTPEQLVNMAIKDHVDLAICTEALDKSAELSFKTIYRWNRCLIAPQQHPILQYKQITLKHLCDYPLITYIFGFTGRGNLNQTFKRADLQPQIALSAADTDVIKTYVREGLGIGIIADLAFNEKEDHDLQKRDLSHLFPWETTKVAYLNDTYLRTFQRRFIELFQQETHWISAKNPTQK
ncbi:MAG: LysR substrate-binding domain-containing protein [Gammaproteobacteria bacterium]|nr:LysR substrate-binding domain-containing protein [Gammaproteobacteria bacterium]